MSRYIDADATIKRLKSWFCDKCDNYNGVRCRACLIDDAICAIDDTPTADVVEKEKYDRLLENSLIVSSALQKYQKADVVEVVRCRECVMWDGSFKLNGQKKCLNMTFCTDGDFYCGWGTKE